MDPIAILQNRIEQLEAKLGFATNALAERQQGDSATNNLLNAAQAVNNATIGHEKLSEAMPMANELNNYSDPNFVEMNEQNNKHMLEVASAEPMVRHHCHCMHRCKQPGKKEFRQNEGATFFYHARIRQQNLPVLESEPIQHVPEMQAAVDEMQKAAAEVKAEADSVSQGIQEVAETCGAAAAAASEQLAAAAQRVEQAEQKLNPRRRNGLD